jgi:hypothetical protein
VRQPDVIVEPSGRRVDSSQGAPAYPLGIT